MKTYTIQEAADKLDKSYGYVKSRIESNEIKAIKIGSTYRIPQESLQAFMENNKKHDGFSIEEFAEAINVSYGLINSLIKKGEIKANKDGRKYVIPTEELGRYLNVTVPGEKESDIQGKLGDRGEKALAEEPNGDEMDDILRKIEKLNELYRKNAITEIEFNTLKNSILRNVK